MTDQGEPSRLARTFAALANRDYRKFYVGQGVSLIGSWLQAAAVSWIVYDRTHSERWLGFVEATGVVPGLIVGLFAGALADRLRPRLMILCTQCIQMMLAFLLAAIVASKVEPVLAMTIIVALTRVFVTFEMPSRQVFLHQLVGKSGLLNAIALNSGLFNASRVIGPALAGLCLAWLGESACFALNGLSYLGAIAALLAIRHGTEKTKEVTNVRERTELLGGFRYIRHDRVVATLFVLIIAMGMLGMGYSALAAAYARRTIGTQAGGYSSLLACAGIGATIGALIVASRSGGKRPDRVLLMGLGLFALALAGSAILPILAGPLGSWARIIVASACLMGVGFGAVIFYASAQMMIQHLVPDELRGRVMGVWMIAYSGSVPIGCLWAGELAARTNVPAVMLLSAALCCAMVIITDLTGVLRPQSRAT